ncbi:MAG: iron-sulfur cluster assembly scaffold protein [Alphaproteobacteria bacterium]
MTTLPRLGSWVRIPSPAPIPPTRQKWRKTAVSEAILASETGRERAACALGQASSSIMAQRIVGSTIDELLTVRGEMLRMLKQEGPPPAGRFFDLAALQPVRDFRARHASTMLTFDAVADAIASLDAADSNPKKATELV